MEREAIALLPWTPERAIPCRTKRGLPARVRQMTNEAPAPLDEQASAVPDPRDRRAAERRSGRDRRAGTVPPPGVERRAGDRRGTDRRAEPAIPDLYRAGERSINEYPLSPDELEFINALNGYKRKHSRNFPTWSEVLHIVRALGYRKPPTRGGSSA
jgi:hypothetical protein